MRDVSAIDICIIKPINFLFSYALYNSSVKHDYNNSESTFSFYTRTKCLYLHHLFD